MTATIPDVTTGRRLAILRDRLAQTQPQARTLPSHPALRDLLTPGLRRGAVHSFIGGTSLGVALLAGASGAGSWCAVVGFPDFGVENASAWGVDLERLVLTPRITGDQWIDAVSTLLEAVDVVLACPAPTTLPPGARNRLQARLRHRGATLLVAGPWAGAASELRVTGDRWHGLQQGRGSLTAREFTVTREHGHRTRTATVRWPPIGRIDQ